MRNKLEFLDFLDVLEPSKSTLRPKIETSSRRRTRTRRRAARASWSPRWTATATAVARWWSRRRSGDAERGSARGGRRSSGGRVRPILLARTTIAESHRRERGGHRDARVPRIGRTEASPSRSRSAPGATTRPRRARASGGWVSGTRTREHTPTRPTTMTPSCRICFAREEEGRLFSPCRCRGTMKHVHVKCLDAWRRASERRIARGGGRFEARTSRATSVTSATASSGARWAARLKTRVCRGGRRTVFAGRAGLAHGRCMSSHRGTRVNEGVRPSGARAQARARTVRRRRARRLRDAAKSLALFFERLAARRPSTRFPARSRRRDRGRGRGVGRQPAARALRAPRRACHGGLGGEGGGGAFSDGRERGRSLNAEGAFGLDESRCVASARRRFCSTPRRGGSRLRRWDPRNGPRWMVHRAWVADLCDRVVAGRHSVGVLGFAARSRKKRFRKRAAGSIPTTSWSASFCRSWRRSSPRRGRESTAGRRRRVLVRRRRARKAKEPQRAPRSKFVRERLEPTRAELRH